MTTDTQSTLLVFSSVFSWTRRSSASLNLPSPNPNHSECTRVGCTTFLYANAQGASTMYELSLFNLSDESAEGLSSTSNPCRRTKNRCWKTQSSHPLCCLQLPILSSTRNSQLATTKPSLLLTPSSSPPPPFRLENQRIMIKDVQRVKGSWGKGRLDVMGPCFECMITLSGYSGAEVPFLFHQLNIAVLMLSAWTGPIEV
jgi:hypothetical protein